MKRVGHGVAGLAVAAVVMVGCSSSTVIDESKAVDGIQQILDDAGVATTSIECPSDVEVVEGETFDCEVTTTDEVTFAMVVTMTDAEGSVDITSSDDVVLMTAEVMDAAANEIASQAGEDVELRCPSAAPLDAGTGSVTCVATGETGEGSVTIGFEGGQLVSAELD